VLDNGSQDNPLRGTRFESRSKATLRVKRFSGYVREIGELTGHLVKIGAVFSLTVGAILLVGYLNSVGAPLPPMDTSFGTFFALLTCVFVWFALVVGSLILIPALAILFGRVEPHNIFSELYSNSPFTRSYTRAYVSYFRSFLLMVVAFYFCFLIRVQYPHARAVLGCIPLAGGIGLFWLFSSVRRKCPKGRAGWIVWDAVLWPTLMSFIWFTFLVLIAGTILDRTLPGSSVSLAEAVLLGCFVFLVGLHYIISARSKPSEIGIYYMIVWIVILVVYPGIPFLGGLALRFLGIGGGVPVRMLVKTEELGTAQTIAKDVKGCLILATGSVVLISPVDHREECHLKASFGVGVQASPGRYDTVERYALSDVLKFSRFPQ